MKDNVNTSPLVSVILPVRNNAKFLAGCLDSLFSQNYAKLEIIAIDDKSTDTSWNILKEYKKRHKQLKIFRNVKQYGLSVRLNRAIKRVKGSFLLFMDARDTITKNKIQKQVDYLDNNKKAVAVGTQCMYINDNDKRIGKSNFPHLSESISQKPLHGISVMFEGIMIHRQRIPKDLLRFTTRKETLLYSDMAMKLLQYGEIANLPEYLHLHRKHTKEQKFLPGTIWHPTLPGTRRYLALFPALLKLWIKSRFEYGITPSFKSFFGISLR